MKVTFKNSNPKKFQTGGTMAPDVQMQEDMQQPVGQPTQEPEQDPITILAQMSSQAIQSQDCEMAMQVCQAFLEIVQQMQGAPSEQQEEPVFRKGGILVRRIKK